MSRGADRVGEAALPCRCQILAHSWSLTYRPAPLARLVPRKPDFSPPTLPGEGGSLERPWRGRKPPSIADEAIVLGD